MALSRAGYLADTSPYEQHHLFARWAMSQQPRWAALEPGQRLVGEWMAQAHGTRYDWTGEPFVPFDLMVGRQRLCLDQLRRVAVAAELCPAEEIGSGPMLVMEAMRRLEGRGNYGALDPVEGAVWRVERDVLIDPGKGGERRRVVDFLAKFVRSDKVDGAYLPDVSGGEVVWNWRPERG